MSTHQICTYVIKTFRVVVDIVQACANGVTKSMFGGFEFQEDYVSLHSLGEQAVFNHMVPILDEVARKRRMAKLHQ